MWLRLSTLVSALLFVSSVYASETIILEVQGPTAFRFLESDIDYNILIKDNDQLIAKIDLPDQWFGRDYFYYQENRAAALNIEYQPRYFSDFISASVRVEVVELDSQNLPFVERLSQLGSGKPVTLNELSTDHPMFPELQQNLALFHLNRGELSKAWQTLESEEPHTDPKTLRLQLKIKRDMAEYEQAERYGELALAAYDQINLDSEKSKLDYGLALADMGDVYLWLGKFEIAEALLNKGLSYSTQSNRLTSMIYNNLAGVYDLQLDYEQAKPYKEKAVALALEAGDNVKAAQSTYLIGHGYRALGRYDLARKYFHDALTLLGDSDGGVVRAYI